ncbi:hypothetical protein ESCOCK434M_24865 [Escherichia coli]
MLPSETMIWQPEFTDKTLSRKPGAVQRFTLWINSQLLIMRNGFFTPFNRVAGVMTQALIATGELDTEITQESIHSDAVG